MKNYKLTDETKMIFRGTFLTKEIKLHRIVATNDFITGRGIKIKEGQIGGWIQRESNLHDNAWVFDDSMIYDNAFVGGDSIVSINSVVCDNSTVAGGSVVKDHSTVCGNAAVFENSLIYNDSVVKDNARVDSGSIVSDHSTVCDNALVSDRSMVNGYSKVYDNALILNNSIIRCDALVGGDAIVESINDYIVFKNSWSSGRFFTWTKSNDMWSVGCFYGTGEELIKKAYKDSEDSGKHYELYVKLVESLKGVEG